MIWNKKKEKYNAKKTIVDGIKFDSKAESEYYLILKDMHEKNKIELLLTQPKTYLTDAKILYKPDFLIMEDEKLVYIDIKGMCTPVFNIKKRLWKHYHDCELRIIKRSGKRFVVTESVMGSL